jgi:coenzyme F420-reducing hydrogenase delta subunit
MNPLPEAGVMAQAFKIETAEGLQVVKVPCVGKVNQDCNLTAFIECACGVLIMACHTGNCKPEHSNLFTQRRINEMGAKIRHS